MQLRLCAERRSDRRERLGEALARVVAVCAAEPEVREAFVIRETTLGIVDRVADLKLAAQRDVPIDIVVVTPDEFRSTFAASSFGRTLIAQARRIYAA